MGRREPVLPVLTRGRPSGVAVLPSTSAAGGLVPKRQHGLWERAALLLVVAVLVAALAACTAAAAVSCYALSIIHEPSGAVRAAAAQAQAAADKAAAAAAQASGGQRVGLAAGPLGNSSSSRQYTVVVMSYSKRLPTLPLVLNKLGSCPSVAEVLLVWNGDDPPPTSLFDTRAPLRIRTESKNDLSHRMRPDPGITTDAVLLADDDVLLRCADVERAFARWHADRQAIVGFFPRLGLEGPPPQYLGERTVFQRRRFNLLLTAGELVSWSLLERYWSERYAQGRAMVSRLLNCEDILLNFVAAAAIQEQQQQQQGGGSGSQQAAALPHAVWAQPGRRLDISILSKVGISRAGASHTNTRARCFAQFCEWYGRDLVQEQQIEWDRGSAPWRLFTRPVCGVPGLGCLYL